MGHSQLEHVTLMYATGLTALAEVKAASPNTQVIVPEYFRPIVVKANQNPSPQNK
jgi:hypothetical protein